MGVPSANHLYVYGRAGHVDSFLLIFHTPCPNTHIYIPFFKYLTFILK